ncbi:hypothetical protein B5M19_00740 [Mesomycoplasma hyopneumoniae]|uniref:Uncharacterized protein n=2 Tax=Mesomycoplasma hyopneumoniae (strain 168) TaxID=907287 RepID=E4QT23_MESH1|nr:Predicted protein [Mesomycoplasma hyopneumoniae 168]AGM22149.1 hypothetical protein MHP168L_371 [Mesomycoplasma hyopneumoniae 168-L]MXR12859.1 hypothetical protein [Mesomycoplasma hyopneumoniae]OWY74157.1 hypothetical protein B5M19_00740 [Mesomycoplasma hyopneumoniae]
MEFKGFKSKILHFAEEFREIYKKSIMKNVKFHTKGQFCMYMKQFNNKLAKKFDKSMKNKSR